MDADVRLAKYSLDTFFWWSIFSCLFALLFGFKKISINGKVLNVNCDSSKHSTSFITFFIPGGTTTPELILAEFCVELTGVVVLSRAHDPEEITTGVTA